MPERILCVDDDASFLDTLKRTLHGKSDVEVAVAFAAAMASTSPKHGPWPGIRRQH